MEKWFPVSYASLLVFVASMTADAVVSDAIQQAVGSATGPTRPFMMLIDTLTKDPAQAVEFVAGLPALATIGARSFSGR